MRIQHLLLLLLLPVLAAAQPSPKGRYFDISKNLEIFSNAFREINTGYVDDLSPDQVMNRALDAMLEGLDPFTNYISETDVESYRIQGDGKYSGLGANGEKIGDWVVINEIYENSPALKAGLKVGDAILSIDGQSAAGKSAEQVFEFLRGFPGTKVDLRVRHANGKEIDVRVEREAVEVPNVPYTGLVGDKVGYINLTTFSEDASANISKALSGLKSKYPDLKGVVLDLRDNGGGLLNEAVSIVNLFVPRGELVVSTKGKVPEWDLLLRAQHTPLDEKIPVVVLVNDHSASASEVVSGALQDLDRGVIMGQRSYGKGLVQNTKEIGYNARIKLTTAKYYSPSGRCIQSTRYKDGKPVNIPDNERGRFKTRNGRTVLDGGGITPDVMLPADTATGVVKALLDQKVIFDYANQFALKHEKIDSFEAFTFSDWADFSRFVENRKFSYETPTEKKLNELRKTAAATGLNFEAELNAIAQKINAEKNGELERNKVRLLREVEQEIVSRYYFKPGRVRSKLKNDPEVQEAVKLINDPARYMGILKG